MLEMDDDINDIVDAAPTTPCRAPPRTPRSAARSARSARSSGFAHQGHPHPRVAQTPRKRGGRRTKQPPIHEQAGAGVGSDCADDTGAAAEADVQPVVRTRYVAARCAVCVCVSARAIHVGPLVWQWSHVALPVLPQTLAAWYRGSGSCCRHRATGPGAASARPRHARHSDARELGQGCSCRIDGGCHIHRRAGVQWLLAWPDAAWSARVIAVISLIGEEKCAEDTTARR